MRNKLSPARRKDFPTKAADELDLVSMPITKMEERIDSFCLNPLGAVTGAGGMDTAMPLNSAGEIRFILPQESGKLNVPQPWPGNVLCCMGRVHAECRLG